MPTPPTPIHDVPGRSERRRHPRLDAHRVARKLWQGSYPRATVETRQLSDDGFSLLVLCAVEHQPPASHFPGTHLLRVPLVDDYDQPLPASTWTRIEQAAWRIATHHREGGRVLVTCHMGWNRSGIVATTALALLAPTTPIDQLIEIVQRRRPNALSNPRFVEALRTKLTR